MSIFWWDKDSVIFIFDEHTIFRNIGGNNWESARHSLHDSIRLPLEEGGEDEEIGYFEKLWDVGTSTEEDDIFFASVVFNLMKEIFFFITIADDEKFRIFEIAHLEGFEEIVMAFVYMEVGDADDDEVGRSDAEGLPEIRIRSDGIEIFYVDTVRNDSYFFRMHPDVLDIEIFHGNGVGEILIDE